MTEKKIIDFTVTSNQAIGTNYALLTLRCGDGTEMPHCEPGQFVEVKAPDSAGVLLRRPISINDVNPSTKELKLLVRIAGRATEAIVATPVGSVLNIVLPLGNGFSIPAVGSRPLLVGGGVGVAPLLYFGRCLSERGIKPTFLLGARSAADLLLVEEFKQLGDVVISTDDGSEGTPGVVTVNPALTEGTWSSIHCCGPMPMMKAVAKVASTRGIDCEVSLENVMACGLGACLCCVENTKQGHVCVCTEGPVFNTNQLLWQD